MKLRSTSAAKLRRSSDTPSAKNYGGPESQQIGQVMPRRGEPGGAAAGKQGAAPRLTPFGCWPLHVYGSRKNAYGFPWVPELGAFVVAVSW
jgi:hypothetical protein